MGEGGARVPAFDLDDDAAAREDVGVGGYIGMRQLLTDGGGRDLYRIDERLPEDIGDKELVPSEKAFFGTVHLDDLQEKSLRLFGVALRPLQGVPLIFIVGLALVLFAEKVVDARQYDR
jgi:hypothetical protein